MSTKTKTKKSTTKKSPRELTAEQVAELQVQEERIEKAQDSFFEMIDALHVIEAHKLYGKHGSLAAYCRFRWDMSGSTVSHYKAAYAVVAALKAAGFAKPQLPTNEGQARALARMLIKAKKGYDTKKVVSTWKKLIKSGAEISAKTIADAGPTGDDDVEVGTAARRSRVTDEAIFVAVSNTTDDDVKKLQGLLGIDPLTTDGTSVFAFNGEDIELFVSKITQWFVADGSRTADIHLSK